MAGPLSDPSNLKKPKKSKSQSDPGNGLVNGDRHHGGAKNSSDYDDMLLSDESTSIDESNLVDSIASDSESDQENGIVNRDSPEYCDLQISGKSASDSDYNAEYSGAGYSSYTPDIERKVAMKKS